MCLFNASVSFNCGVYLVCIDFISELWEMN
jgi:hypothetical protein